MESWGGGTLPAHVEARQTLLDRRHCVIPEDEDVLDKVWSEIERFSYCGKRSCASFHHLELVGHGRVCWRSLFGIYIILRLCTIGIGWVYHSSNITCNLLQ